jgi:hypothetical protein
MLSGHLAVYQQNVIAFLSTYLGNANRDGEFSFSAGTLDMQFEDQFLAQIMPPLDAIGDLEKLNTVQT